jgi:hypothetical protein
MGEEVLSDPPVKSSEPPQHPSIDNFVAATSDVITPDFNGDKSRLASLGTIVKTTLRTASRKSKTPQAESRTRSKIEYLETDVVSQNYRHLDPIQLRNCNLRDGKPMLPPGEATRSQAVLGLLFLFIALGITSAPLFDSSIDAEKLQDDSGLVVKKLGKYAKAWLMGPGFFDDFMDKIESGETAVSWFPQPSDKTFLNHSFLNASALNGACSIFNESNANRPECIIMTGHQGGVSAYGLCRNGSEYVSVHYIQELVTPADIGGLVSTGTWIENARESILIGLESSPECIGDTVVITPNLSDFRGISGAFKYVAKGPTNQWFDVMGLPSPVRERMFYLEAKSGTGQGLTIPSKKRQSFDDIIAQNTYGSTLADKLTIAAPNTSTPFVYVTMYRVAGAAITLPRLQFTFAVAAQALALLIFILIITVRNGALRTFHLVHQLLRLPTFCIISLQLLYVLYYQIFDIAYVGTNDVLTNIFSKKVVYVSGVGYILLHQLDVRAAVTLWPKMANNDSYYFGRIVWMLASLGVFLWSLFVKDGEHYVVATSSTCALGASECNETKMFFMQHYVCLAVFIAHPFAYGFIQVVQWYRNKHEYYPRDDRLPDLMTSFEAYGCGGPLGEYYYYNTLVTKEVETNDNGDSKKAVQYLTCAKAVRDEGFVLLGGCDALVRAKDLYLIMFMKVLNEQLAGNINLSVVVAHIQNHRLTPMRRVSYRALWHVCQRWDGHISYPDIG